VLQKPLVTMNDAINEDTIPRFTVLSKLVGPISLFVAALSMASANVMYSYFGDKASNKTAVLFWTSTTQVVFLAPFCVTFKIQNIYSFAAGTTAMFLINACGSVAFLFADPNDITAIISTCIFITPLLSYLFFRIRFNRCVLPLMTCTCFAGIILLVQPPFIFHSTSLTLTNGLGYCFAFINMLSHAFLMCIQRVSHESDIAMIFWALVLISMITGAVCIFTHSDFLPLPHLPMFAISALLNCFSFFLLMKGWSLTDPRASSMILQNQTLFTFFLSWVFGMEKDNVLIKAMGVITVIFSTLVYLWFTFDAEDSIRHTSRFMEIFISERELNDPEKKPLLC